MTKQESVKALLQHAIKAKRRELWGSFIDGACVSANLLFLLAAATAGKGLGWPGFFSIAIIAWCMVTFVARIRSNNRAYARMLAKVKENGDVDG